jgi:DNA-binding transcriptional ArsR family regulator
LVDEVVLLEDGRLENATRPADGGTGRVFAKWTASAERSTPCVGTRRSRCNVFLPLSTQAAFTVPSWLLGHFAKHEGAAMDAKTRTHYQHRALVMKALAHPTRLFLVDRLAEGETCVCELAGLVGVDVSTISRHLSILKSAGIVTDEKRGNQVFYSLRVRCVLGWYRCVEGVLEAAAEAQLAAVR